jgi:1-acyl-sn-glycerol-3-phosphate acyltransferase
VEEVKTVPVKPINIREVFKSKNPQMARFIPGFIYKFMNSVMQLDFINDLIKKHGHLKGVEFINKVVEEFNVRVYLHGMDNIPGSGRFIFTSNHPLGGFDGMLLLKAVEEKLGNPKFLTNDILLNIPQLKPLFVPVNKFGSHSREAATRLNETYNSDAQILIFPSGYASRMIRGKIIDLEWKKHFIAKAVQYKRDIVPVFVAGHNSKRFYRIANLRKFLKIKWNLEMFLLPDETVRHRNTDVHLYFGQPIAYTTFDSSKTHQDWSLWVREKVYNLPDEQA